MDVVVTNEPFERWWSFSAERAAELWAGPELAFVRLAAGAGAADLELPGDTTRLLLLTLELDASAAVLALPQLREVAFYEVPERAVTDALTSRGVEVYTPRGEGYWGQSVAEYALGLTIAALRRMPQTHDAMRRGHEIWQYLPPEGEGWPGTRAAQFGDDAGFTSGTVAGKRVRVLGMGNIGSRYAAFCHALGADVAAWSRSAPDPAYHRSGARRVTRLDELVGDAQIFAPMVPLTAGTEGLVDRALIDALPDGCLVVLVTRAQVVDMAALRERVLRDELSLAADVFDVEPLPVDDPLVGRHNVVHTPHNAGRTIDANHALVDNLLEQFHVLAPSGSLVR
ncbi:MAG: hydroxyacid dehydrogenase [Actinobacteria bacterium]|nr:hydroxyacid dehydrogenase [Actinomycetota bacterium]